MRTSAFVLLLVSLFSSNVRISGQTFEIQSRGFNGHKERNEDYPFLVKIIAHYRERSADGKEHPENGCPTVKGRDPHEEINNPSGNSMPPMKSVSSARPTAASPGFQTNSVPAAPLTPAFRPAVGTGLKEVVDRYRGRSTPFLPDCPDPRRCDLPPPLFSFSPSQLSRNRRSLQGQSLKPKASGRHFRFPCTGTLIATNFVLTAGHCTRDENQDAFYTIQVPWGEALHGSVAFRHPGCQIIESGWAVNDIALIKLDSCVPYRYLVPLSSPSYFVENTTDVVHYVGYGKTKPGRGGPSSSETPTRITFNTYPKMDCADTHYSVKLEDVICATPQDGIVLSGDSGGPLLKCNFGQPFHFGGAPSGGRGTSFQCSQLGVLSWSYTEVTGHSNTTLFMNAYQSHRQWIEDIISRNADPKCNNSN